MGFGMKLQYSFFLSDLSSNEVFYLDCSCLETGTHKGLRSKYIIECAVRDDVKNIFLITAGNAGLSLKRAIENSGADINLVNVVPDDLEDKTVRLLAGRKSQVVKSDLEKEFLSFDGYDATYVEGPQYDGMIKKVVDIYPDYVLLPVGSGELFNCFYNYFKQNGVCAGLVGVVPKGNHPLSSGRDGKTLADKLSCRFMNPKALDKIGEALSAGHSIVEIDNEHIRYCLSLSANLGLDLEPSAAVPLFALDQMKYQRVVCVLTGKGVSSKECGLHSFFQS